MEFVDSSSSSSDVSDYEVFCQIFQTLHKQHADCGTNEATVWLRVYKRVTKLCKDDETEDPVDKDEEEQEEQVGEDGDKDEDENTDLMVST